MEKTENPEKTYNIKNYSDAELLDILDLSNPTDLELEAKILSMIRKYKPYKSHEGKKLWKFYENIYSHFFENEDNPEETLTTDETTPTTTEAAKEPQKNSNDRSVNYSVALDYSKDKLNPLLKQTTKRMIVIDSQYRDNRNTTLSTNFTFNLSDTLKDVVNLKLYSFQIPYTWYTVNDNYGSNFFKFKAISSGIQNNEGTNDIIIKIPSGNYSAANLVSAVNTSFVNLQTNPIYTDISFGTTAALYDQVNSKCTLTIDLKKQFNENFYNVSFQNWTSPYVDPALRDKSIPSFFGFANNSYDCNIIYANRTILPPTTSEAAIINDNIISTYFLDNTNNYFDIIQYIATSPEIEYSLTPNENITILNDKIRITLSNLQTGTTYTRNEIVNELNTQLTSNYYLINSNISRVDISDISFNGNYYSQFQMKILLNRNTTINNIRNQKVAIVFPNDNIIWTGQKSVFLFDNRLYELSNIISEERSIAYQYPVYNYPMILLKCIKPFFGYYINRDQYDNNIYDNITTNNYTINVTGLTLNGCTMPEYIAAINNSIKTTNNLTISSNNNQGLGVFDINSSYSYVDVSYVFNIKIDLNKTFSQNSLNITNILFSNNLFTEPYNPISRIPNTDLYTEFNLFNEYLSEINSNANIVIDLSQNHTFISKIPFSYNGFTINVNRLFTIVPKTGIGEGTEFIPPIDINFNGDYTVPYTFYDINEIASYLTSRLYITQLYDTKHNYEGDVEVYNMLQGSYFKCDLQDNYLTIELHIEFNSYLTENDYNVVFVDQTVQNVPTTPFEYYCVKIKPRYTGQNILAYITNNDKYASKQYGYSFQIVSTGVGSTNCLLQYAAPENYETWNPVNDLNNIIYPDSNGSFNDFAGITIISYFYQTTGYNFIGGNGENGGKPIIYSFSNGLSENNNNWIAYKDYTLSTVYCIDILFNPSEYTFIVIATGKDTINKSKTIFYSDPINVYSTTSDVVFNYAFSAFQSNVYSNITPIVYKWITPNYDEDYGNIYYNDISKNLIIACGYSDTASLAYSNNNGKDWTIIGNDLLEYGYDIAYNGNKYIAVGIGRNKYFNMAYSLNGINWFLIDFYCPIELAVYSISCNGNKWVIGGTGINTLAYSLDNGITWVGITNSIFSDTVYSVKYFNMKYKDPNIGYYDFNNKYYPYITVHDLWVVGGKGNNTIAYSNDGYNWNANFEYSPWTTDISNSWAYNLKIQQQIYKISDYRDATKKYFELKGNTYIDDTYITLNETNNKIYLNPITNDKGGSGIYANDYGNSITITIPQAKYNQTRLITTINSLFETTMTINGYNISSGTQFFNIIKNRIPYIKIRTNISKIYSIIDYNLVFYENSMNCSVGKKVVVATWDSTLGWLLGFHAKVSYILSDIITISNTATSTYIVVLTGDSAVSTGIYNYFMIVLNDYNQNHLNDGLITTTKSENNAITPSYTNKALNRCNPTTKNTIVSTIRTNAPSTGDNTNFPQSLTQRQLYAAQEVLNIQNDINPDVIPSYLFTNSPYAKDLFAVLPLKIAGQQNNTVYVDYSGTLQNQERNYFGPVNISRISIQLINDRGQVVDLNSANWSFTLICEQLYQYKKT